jgi:hypothetical protein
MRAAWSDHRPHLLLGQVAGRDRRICGLGLHHLEFWETGGYTYMHRSVPLYRLSAPRLLQAEAVRRQRAFNAVISPADRIDEIPGHWQREVCDDNLCLFVRGGGCMPDDGRNWRVETVLRRLDM